MTNDLLLSFFVCAFLLLDHSSIHAGGKSSNSSTKEIATLTRKLDSLEAQQRNSIAELKTKFESSQASLTSLKSELESLKNKQPNTSAEVLKKIEEQQRSMTDSTELTHILVKYGNNPDGMSTLHYAIKMGDLNAVNMLIANGADINSIDTDFRPQATFTPLMRAASYNQIEITKILLALGADVNFVPNKDCYYPIYYAAKSGSDDLVKLLVENGAQLDRISPTQYITQETTTPLHIAAEQGNYETVVALINYGANVDGNSIEPYRGGSWNSCTPLDWAAASLKYSDNTENLTLIKFLVENGATRRIKQYQKEGPNSIPCSVINGYLQSVNR